MAKPFVLSKEDSEFVSSSEYILSQIESNRYDSSNDLVHYTIYFEATKYDCEQNVLILYDCVKRFLDSLSTSYIWHKDKFLLNCVRNVSDKLRPAYFFEGKSYYGDNIDDEWFIVYMLLKLSSEMPHLNITITDNDGEFMLIEASDHIPQWITPENCTNRVWLKNGKLNIIPLNESSCKATENGITLLNALNFMNIANSTSVCNINVQKCIEDRTTNQYPNKIKATYHNTVCILPIHVAYILQSHPNIISDILICFCNGTKANKSHMSNLSKLGINDVAKNESNYVCIKLLLTRAMYAKLMFQSFHPPKKLHKVMNKVVSAFVRKEELKPDASSNSLSLAVRLATKAFDIGCRLMCGLEVLYQNSEENTLKCSNQLTNKPKELIDNLLIALVSNPDYINQIILSGLLDGDSASWLYLKPEEFEKEMSDRMYFGNNRNSEIVEDSETNSESMMHNLEKMVKNMHLFMEGESSIDGVEINIASDEVPREELGHMEIDIDKVYQALEKHSSVLSSDNKCFDTDYNNYFSSDDSASGSDTEDDEESNVFDTVNGSSTYILKDVDDDFKDFDFVRPADSDDEEANERIGAQEAENFISNYMEEMDKQLLDESLASSFERSPNNDEIIGPVDIDTNLLKYYLESHASQLEAGIPGPISALMTTLGLKMPLEKGEK